MFEWLTLLTVARFGRPLLLFFPLLALLWIVVRATRYSYVTGPKAGAIIAIGFSVLGVVALGAFVSIAVWYAHDSRYYDFAEPTIPSVAWMLRIGRPLYPPVEAADRYAHIYGPMAFIPSALTLWLFGPTIGASKGLAAATGLSTLPLIFAVLRRNASSSRALVLTGYFALLLMIFRNVSFWTRPDPLQLLCVCVGLWATVTRKGFTAALILGLSAGVLWNLKFTGPLYSLPLFVLLYQRVGPTHLMIAIAIALVVAGVPFISPAISLRDYITWIQLSGHMGLVGSIFRQNLEWGLYFLIPVVVSLYARQRTGDAFVLNDALVPASLVAGMGGVMIAASKPGAGSYHLIAFLPVIFYLVTVYTRGGRWCLDAFALQGSLSFVVVATVVALAQQASFISSVREIDTVDAAAEILRFSDEHPDASVEVGYSSNERLTFARPLAVFRSGVYLLDQPAIQEHQLAGVRIPAATLRVLRSCGIGFWLIPKGGRPFSARNRYPGMREAELYDDDFRRAFFETYELGGTTRFFDVWKCAGMSPSPGTAHR
jgi:hypothetical protein